MIVISNTTPILSLFKIGKLEILKNLFGEIIVPEAVYNEIAVADSSKQGADVLDKVEYIKVKKIQNLLAADMLRSQLDYGESETIVLAKELNADILLLDEKKARKVGQANSMKIIGTIGVLQAAKDRGLISDMKTQLDKLIENGIWLDKKLYQTVLQNNGEDC